MSNMSYCKFENTYRDLRDCFIYLKNQFDEDGNKLSKSEQRYRDQLIDLCHQISELDSYNCTDTPFNCD